VTGVSVIVTKAGGSIYSTYSCTNLQYVNQVIYGHDFSGLTQGCMGASGTGAPNGFSFTPQGSTYSATTTPISDASVRLFYNGVAIGNERAVNGAAWSTSPTSSPYGGDGITWGAALTPQIINAPNFGFGIAVNYNPYPNPVASTSSTVDAMQIIWLSQSCTPNPPYGQLCHDNYSAPTKVGTNYNYAYSTNAVAGAITSMSMTVYYNWPYPTVTQTSGLPTTVTVTPVNSATSTVTQTSTITQPSTTGTYTMTLTPVTTTASTTITSTASSGYTYTQTQTSQVATSVTSFTTSSNQINIGPITNFGQMIAVILGSGVTLIGAGGLGTLLRKP